MHNSQQYAVTIEHKMEEIFDCDGFAIDGLVDADLIRRHPILTIMCALTYIYSDQNKKKIDSFFKSYNTYADLSIDDILSIRPNVTEINGISYEIAHDDGSELLKEIIENFENIK